MMLQTNPKDNLLLHRYMFPNREQFISGQSSREKSCKLKVGLLFQGNVKSKVAFFLKVDNETYSSTFTVFLLLFKIIANANSRFGQVLHIIFFSYCVSVK